MEVRTYLSIARRYWWLLILGTTLAAAAAYVGSKQMTPVYQTSVTLLVNQTQNPGTVQYNDILTSERLTNTYAELVTRAHVMTMVRTRLSLPLSEDALAEKISVSTVRNTQLL